jgi:hypothetical protein
MNKTPSAIGRRFTLPPGIGFSVRNLHPKMNDITIETGKIRMATRRQLEANRANAKRSTGPRSADGKAKSSKNSLAHGLTAQDIVIADEDPEEFERLRAGV